MDQFIVSAAGGDFGYLQCYDLTAWNSGSEPIRRAPAASISSSANPTMIERGHGSALIRCFVEGRLTAGAPRIVTDPDPANERAVRAYEKAGFQESAHGRYTRWSGAVDGPQRMVTGGSIENAPIATTLSAVALAVDRRRRSCIAGRDPVCDGTTADLRLRLCQTLARRGAELGEFAAHHRLVHVVARAARLPVLRRDISGCSALGLARPPDRRDAGRGHLGAGRRIQTGSSSATVPARSRWTILATPSSIRFPTRWR